MCYKKRMPNAQEILKTQQQRAAEALSLKRSGLSCAQVAERLGVSRAVAHQRIIRGRYDEHRPQAPEGIIPDDTPWELLRSTLTWRCFNALQNEGVTTVGEARQLSDEQLLRTLNFGKVSLAELRSIIGPARSSERRVNRAAP